MDSIKFQDIKAEKAKAISNYQRIQKLTVLFRILEVFVFLLLVSRFSNHFTFSLKFSSEYFREISVALISPKSVFLIGNAIVVVLILLSGQFSAKNSDFYDEYAEKCRSHNPQAAIDKKNSHAYRSGAKKTIRRVQSENLFGEAERRRELRRTESEKKAANEMSNEEFRQTVEAFIERQQKFLREEEGREYCSTSTAVVSF